MTNNHHGNTWRVLLVAVLASGFCVSDVIAHDSQFEHDGAEVRSAATDFLAALSAELRAKAILPFDGNERTDWHYIPKDRVGVSLREMDLAQRRAAHRLMRAALSDQGYLKATAVMGLEQVLQLMEADRPNVNEIRDQEKYWFAMFGDPTGDDPWGWRVEGHHLSLNFSSATGTVISSTPVFFGANPAEVQVGACLGLRVLGDEEDGGRALMKSLDAEQAKLARIADQAPADIVTVPGESVEQVKQVGLPTAKMSDSQRAMLWQLVGKFARNLEDGFVEKELADIEKAGLEHIYFAWAGSLKPGEGHYYRLHGPTFLIEFDNASGNHIHSVWHSPSNDFGLDVLRRHYAESPHHAEAEYTRVITERANRIVAELDIDNDAKWTRVRDLIADQYRNLRDIHDPRDAEIKRARDNSSLDQAATKARVAAIRAAADLELYTLHRLFVARLAAELSPAQVDIVKDGLTYGVRHGTYHHYLELLPELTEAEQIEIMANLLEAREHAMDAGSADEKHSWFRKYKGRINNFLSAAGYDLKQAEKDWAKQRTGGH